MKKPRTFRPAARSVMPEVSELEVHADADGMERQLNLLDVPAIVVDRPGTQMGVEILTLDRDPVIDRHFEAGASGPAGAGGRRIPVIVRIGREDLVLAIGETAGTIDEQAIHRRVAEAGTGGAEPLHLLTVGFADIAVGRGQVGIL